MVRIAWIFFILVFILTLNYTLLKLAPEYPPTEEKMQEVYYARQVKDGYMTVRTVYADDGPEEREFVLSVVENTLEDDCEKCFYDVADDQSYVRVFEPIPIPVQYFTWVKNVVTDWNWGVSTRVAPNNSVWTVLLSRIPVTLQLNLISLFFYIPIGFILGIIAALNKDSWIDNIISLGVMVFISIPIFVTMTLLLLVFGYQLELVPSQFPANDVQSFWIQFKGLLLPVMGLSFGAIAGLTRLSRAELTEVLTSEFLLLARTKGLTKRQAVIRHAMRNSMVPLVPFIIGSFVGLLTGSVVIERIYTIPGVGSIYLQAMTRNSYDYNLILASTSFYTIIGLFAVLLVDLSYGIVDPRIRMGARR
jgi:oligopeptide transport system permease protein